MSKNLKKTILVAFDVLCYVAAWILSVVILRGDLKAVLINNWVYLLIGVGVFIALNFAFKVYSILLRYAGVSAALKIFAVSVLMLCYNGLVCLLSEQLVIEWAIILNCAIFLTTVASRFFYRVKENLLSSKHVKDADCVRVMVVGAGNAGNTLINEMRTSSKLNMNPVCALDDDEDKINKYIAGVKIVGKIAEAQKFAKLYDVSEIIVAIPSATKKEIAKIVEECQKTKCQVKILPDAYRFTSDVSVANVKPVSINDLLGREQVRVNLNQIVGYIEGKVVLVTGGGGSIGSELCRQIADANPKQLIILDIYENNAYDIEQELKRKLPNLNLLTLIASVRDGNKIEKVFEEYRPQIVFHAAAHKHVPLMETSPNEAVKNNVGGTLNVAETAGKFGVERFVLISTDKAVNPTNVMGATKRICEMIIQSMDKKYQNTDYVAVRFGNVLGSNGSVIPLFKRQIEEGGPITVTHKDIVRYFMTIPEAVSLVLQAGAYANGGEIFVLDMGDQVKIYDLALNMIKLSGLEPFVDIDIKVTGLRPGEKLYEERLMAEEGLKQTQNKKISIGKPLDFDGETFFNKVNQIIEQAKSECDSMKEIIHELVPTYVIDKRKI